MALAPGVSVPLSEAEATRARLAAEGLLRVDLKPLRTDEALVLPVTGAPAGLAVGEFDFPLRAVRPRHYTELLDWPEEEKVLAPRAFDQMGDVVVLKVPEPLWPRRHELGDAILRFLPAARAVFHDHGVHGELRTRKLEPVAGDGDPETTVVENGVRLRVDVSRAYFSPRLGDERARIASLARPGERVIDLFGGVAPLGVQLARKGVEVVSIDLNPAAVVLARRNAAENRVAVETHQGDARAVAQGLEPADRVVMNLPHGARHFLDVAARACRPGGTVHYHEILPDDRVEERGQELVAEFQALGRAARVENVRHVRAYSPGEGHYTFDVRLDP